MSYTEKNLNVITVLLTILIFMCLYLIYTQISILNVSSYNKSNVVYSKAIPVNEKTDKVETIATSDNIQDTLIGYTKPKVTSVSKVSNLLQSMQNAEDIKNNSNNSDDTERDIVNENKDNKWRIEIPKLNVDAHIEEGTYPTVLLTAVGHMKNTSTWNGNVCLAAHNRGYQCNFFKNIKDLKIGDEIIYHTEKGKRVYKVEVNKIIPETDWSYIKETKDDRITLITCEENRREYRRCVQAVQISEQFI